MMILFQHTGNFIFSNIFIIFPKNKFYENIFQLIRKTEFSPQNPIFQFRFHNFKYLNIYNIFVSKIQLDQKIRVFGKNKNFMYFILFCFLLLLILCFIDYLILFIQMYLLSWSVDSYSPIEEHRLLYRKIKPYHGVGIFILKLQADPINMTTFISSLIYTHNFSSF